MTSVLRPAPLPPRSPRLSGTELFRSDVLAVHDWRCEGHDSTREEDSDGFQIVVARRGAFVRQSEGARTFADASTASFWNADETYMVRHPVPGGDSCSVFALPRHAVTELLSTYEPRALDRARLRFPVPAVPIDGRTYLLQRLALESARRPEAMPLETEEVAVEFLHRAVAGGTTPASARRHAMRAERRTALEYAARVRETIARRYREPLSLGDVARAVHCSPYHLSRMVGAIEGVSIHRLIVRLRLREALERLLESNDTVAAIALEVGFGSHSRFSEAFRKEFGITPREARGMSGAARRAIARRPPRH